ncbi:MAG: helix-turn-helix domain-containing protein [Clostridiales bacterium]
MKSANKVKTIDELPLSLTVLDVARVLGVSRGHAYDLCHSKDFPSIILGRRIVVSRLAFEKWMENPNSFKVE